MQQPPEGTILAWMMKQVAELGDLTAEEVERRIRDPDSGLTEAQQAVLLSRDPVRIRAVIEYELGYQVEAYMMHTTPLYFVLPIHI
jgi:hypothetical protein